MIRLIASDIDGTLLHGDETTIPTALFPLIRELKKHNIYFTACSGRQYHNLRTLFAPVADDIGYICENGNLVIWQNQILSRETIDRKIGQALMKEILAQPDCEVLLSGVHTCYMQPKDLDFLYLVRDLVGNQTTVVDDICAVEEPFLKISAYRKSGVDHKLAAQFQSFPPYLTPVVGRSTWMDFLRQGCDKGTALDILCNHLHIKSQQCIAFGDNENDIPVCGHVGTLYAMADGYSGLISRANHTTTSVVDEIQNILKTL